MSFGIEDIFPHLSSGLSGVGFLFGAGTSFIAGYPMMSELTSGVLEALSPDDFLKIQEIVRRTTGNTIEKKSNIYNIEEIADFIESRIISLDSNESDYKELIFVQEKIRKSIYEILNEIKKPNLETHIRFFSALNRIFGSRSENIWIFTTNYDPLFEISASIAGVMVQDGFLGTALRYFRPDSIFHNFGTVNTSFRFTPYPEPRIKLIKLHGSLDWWKCNSKIFSTHSTEILDKSKEKVIILPQKRKIIQTLDYPYDQLFRLSSNIIGMQCKYLVSCGYSYNDSHINTTLLHPKLQQGKINLTALIKDDLTPIDEFRAYPSFAFCSENNSKKRGCDVETAGGNLWDFTQFVEMFTLIAGMK